VALGSLFLGMMVVEPFLGRGALFILIIITTVAGSL
jgi:hypothetical protein